VVATSTRKQKKIPKKLKGFSDGLSYPTSRKTKKQEEAQLPALNPIPFRIQGSRMGNGISP